MTKNKKIKIIIIGLIILLVCVVFIFGPQLKQPVASTTGLGLKKVELGEEFSLKKGEIAKVKGKSVSLHITGFINNPCPENADCTWSGQAVKYELTVGGKVYNNSYESPYDVTQKDTNYKTYSKFIIEDSETNCKKHESSDVCMRTLSERYSDKSYCARIYDATIKDSCYEYFAEKANDSNLCQIVAIPKSYCLYKKSVSTNNLAQCKHINTFQWRIRCFKEIAAKIGPGDIACNELRVDYATECKQALTASDY